MPPPRGEGEAEADAPVGQRGADVGMVKEIARYPIIGGAPSGCGPACCDPSSSKLMEAPPPRREAFEVGADGR